jgi:hypothetical protein
MIGLPNVVRVREKGKKKITTKKKKKKFSNKVAFNRLIYIS